MVILSDRFQLVKVTDHALERLVKRFSIRKRSCRRVLGLVLSNGEVIKKNNHGHEQEYDNIKDTVPLVIRHGNYDLVAIEDEKGFMTVVTVVNRDKYE